MEGKKELLRGLMLRLLLADIENDRANGETITGFDWMFYLYGPWAGEYDPLLKELQDEDAIRVQPWASGDIDGERFIPRP